MTSGITETSDERDIGPYAALVELRLERSGAVRCLRRRDTGIAGTTTAHRVDVAARCLQWHGGVVDVYAGSLGDEIRCGDGFGPPNSEEQAEMIRDYGQLFCAW